ncbi:MAG TPA: ethylbenzene dehydrogenase-related protein [Hyphomicrobiaceae bacterium]|nr:ethylbenzene dehydrogenase-related protein [Hyphomicrobiaceae bacterium]
MKKASLYLSVAVFLGALGVSWLTHGTGVIQNDTARNIYIPKELTMPLQVKAAYNGHDMVFRYRWPAKQPSIYHDMLKFDGGKWVRYGASVAGPQPQGIYEDRVTMLVDDGSVPEFARYGGYVAVGDRMRFFTNEAKPDEVKAHPYLGQKRKQIEVGKYLPATRSNINDWASVVPEEQLAALRKAGYFLDLWHWRAHRSNPIDASDDQYVFELRAGDAGRGPFADNWDPEKRQPRFMLDPDKTGRRALSWDDLKDRKLGFDDVYFITETTAVPFDVSYAWKDGDTIPRRLLRPGDGSHGNIKVAGKARWQDGYWEVTLTRAMDTGSPTDDKIFVDRGGYNLAFAVHRDTLGSRWHYVSLPVTLGLGRDADLMAARFEGDAPQWQQPWYNMVLFYPGQVSWPHLNSARHAGAEKIREGVPVKSRHSEIQLAHYGVEAEFAEAIRWQWLLTVGAGVLLIAGFGIALNGLLARKGG